MYVQYTHSSYDGRKVYLIHYMWALEVTTNWNIEPRDGIDSIQLLLIKKGSKSNTTSNESVRNLHSYVHLISDAQRDQNENCTERIMQSAR